MRNSPPDLRKTKPLVTVTMLGARMHYAVPRILYNAGYLNLVFTDSYIGNKKWLENLIKIIPPTYRLNIIQRYLSRKDRVLPNNIVSSSELLGFWYVWALSRTQCYTGRERVHAMAAKKLNKIVLKAGFGESNIIWGYNTASLELFESEKTSGKIKILEQTILPKVEEIKLLKKELNRWPNWEKGLQIPEEDSVLVLRESQEWRLADYIVVGSKFVYDGLIRNGVNKEKIRIIPYGVEARNSIPNLKRKHLQNQQRKRLRLLFAGHVNIRKGVPYLLSAIKNFKASEIHVKIAGAILLNNKYTKNTDKIEFLGQVPRPKMQQLYDWADVFVLPTIIEGSATVVYEALMSGTPIITTPNAGSIVRDGVDGYIIPVCDINALTQAINKYIKDKTLLQRHQLSIHENSDRASLQCYQKKLESFFISLVNTN